LATVKNGGSVAKKGKIAHNTRSESAMKQIKEHYIGGVLKSGRGEKRFVMSDHPVPNNRCGYQAAPRPDCGLLRPNANRIEISPNCTEPR